MGKVCNVINHIVWTIEDVTDSVSYGPGFGVALASKLAADRADRTPVCEPLRTSILFDCDGDEFCQQPSLDEDTINGYCEFTVPKNRCESACQYICEKKECAKFSKLKEKKFPEAPSGCLFQTMIDDPNAFIQGKQLTFSYRCVWNTQY